MSSSQEYFSRGKKIIPGGVNSPVRAFGSVGGNPIFFQKGNGALLTDVEGKEYIDFVASWGPMILGHNHPQILKAVTETAQNGLSFGAPCPYEIDLAETITRLTNIDMVRMVNSGTEATMSAIRLARGYTGRDKIIKFEGCYHGHADSLLVKSGSGLLTAGVPSSEGVPEAVAADTLNATYNDLDSVEALLKHSPEEVACIIVEPVAANMGVVPPKEGFLQGLRQLCDAYGVVLLFDEVITGFRLGLGGAQEYFGVSADLVTYGKIIGGGLPVGAYGGKREIMEHIAPLGNVYQAGTLSGNPVAMAAGLAQLQALEEAGSDFYKDLENRTQIFAKALEEIGNEKGVPLQVNAIGSLCCPFFASQPVTDYHGATQSDTAAYATYFTGMLAEGIYLAPSQFEAMFLGSCHSDALLEAALAAAEKVLSQI